MIPLNLEYLLQMQSIILYKTVFIKPNQLFAEANIDSSMTL